MGAKLLLVCFVIFLFWDGCQARSAGQEFATAFMQNYISPFEAPLFQLYITSVNSNCLVKVNVPGLRFTQELQLTAGQGITVTLPEEVELSGTKRSRNTVLIQASDDITVSSLNSKQYTSDTSLVYPTSEWGTEYFVFTPTNSPPSMLKEFVLVNGKEQNTVEVFLRAAVRFEGRLYGVGSKLSVVMNPFENAQIQSQGDLTGTRVSSQLPIAVYSGHMCTWRFSKCNHVYEQLLPVQRWGTQFLVAPFSIQSQFDSVYVQASQSTNVTVQFGRTTLNDVLQRGMIIEYKIQFPDGLNIIADSGIQVFFLFNGLRTSYNVMYDPFLVNILPNNQFCSSYALDGIAGFDNRALLIVPTNEQAGILFDRLPLPGKIQWRVIRNSEYSWTEVVYQPGAGGHKVTHASASFGVYSVGIDQVNGYGAPAPCIDPVSIRSCYSISCSQDEECQMMDSFPTCVKKPVGMCWAMGDPHYSTFDQHYFDFMGTCTYVVTRNCQKNDSLPAFEVLAKNENRGDTRVSYVALVIVNIGGITISIEGSDQGKVRIDQSVWSLPVILDDVGVSMFQSGSFITILFSFGLNVQYAYNHYLVVFMPTAFMNKVCGLCGNFNGDPNDDFTMPSSTQAPNATVFGQSWKVHNLTWDEGCRDDNTGHECDAQALKRWEGENYCGLLMKKPFIQCHSVIDPAIYIQNCLFDVCMADGQRKHLCNVLEVYSGACQRFGIQITNWREAANCSYRCPENSHYEFCGSACPLTCMGLGAHLNCTLPCVETCACDPGFVLSGSKCVRTAQCGCSYNGRYVPAGEDFWADDACQRLCRCSTEGGHLECQVGGCGAGQHCQVVNGIRDCYPVSQSTCMALGDPHYYTFDGKYFDFQGNCMYQLVGVCASDPGLVTFDVLVQNDFRGSRAVTFTKLLEIKISNISIVIDREYSSFVTVNGELLNLPVSLIEGQVSVFRSGWFAVVQTSFGLRVTFDWNSFATVTVPSTYMGAVCGLCGNYNGNPEDDLNVRGTTLPSSGPVEFGASWLVDEIPDCVHGCTDSCLDCDPAKKSFYGTSDFCGLLHDPQGPFRDCQTVLNPEPYFEGCVYDVCLYNGRRDILCQSITAYVSACQLMGKTISPWRTAEFCGVQCPVHSHYELCGSGCEVTCHSLAPPTGCRSHCTEGCVCDQGYIRSGDRCVPLSQCGCLYGNRYYLLYQQFYPGNNCEQVCTCSADGQVVCNKLSCGSYEKCELVDGVRRCQPIGKAVCEAAGDPHYMSFDRHRFDFQGTCTYILSQSCGLEQTSLTPFSIQVENERWWPNSMVAVTKLVALTVYGSTLIIRQNEPQILVNGVLTNVPYSSNSLNGSLVQAYKDGSNYVIETGFGLRVTYDRLYYVTVTVPGNYRGKTCGLCGNFDGDSSNDFHLPDGNITQDVNAFGRAWKVDVPGAVCLDGCKSGTCLDCDPRLKAIYERRPYCGVLVDPSGPFAACHAVLNPSAYLNDCVFDTCASAGSSKVVCDSVARYAFSCRAAGVIIQKWRTDSFCPMPCPAHSHYELCADVCSTACPGITTKIQCPQTCTEGCACDSGYLFDGQQCVEHQQCGCYEQGRTFKAGEVVYLDQCEQKCQCDPGKGLSCERVNCPNDTQCLLRAGVWACYHQDPCQDVHCREKETCRFEHGKAVCVPLYNSTCWAWGDPHYHTFDGYEYDFQGTCKYVLSKTCGNLSGLAPFSVTESNEYRGDPDVSYVREVEVIVYGNTLTMENHQKGLIMVDGLVFNLPLDLHDGRVRVRESGNAVLLETDFGLRVSYDWDSSVDLQLPSSYYGVVCGLCGNFNENAGDELRNPAGNLLPSVYQWAKSWRAEDNVTPVCHDGCETNCPVCSHDIRALYETDAFCGVLTSTGLSVFNACHAKVKPQTFQQSCVYDLCFSKGGQRILCQALETYVARCRQEGVVITDWREKLNCSMTCPPNSHYEACASPCPVTCPYPDQQHNCTDTCVEACVCDRGFVLSSGTCVPTNQCGCSYEGAYYHQGQTFWADDQCHRLCECDSNLRVVVCRESSCAPGESCSVVNGRRSCQPMSSAVCVAAGDPHYHTFDGLRFDFQGTCVYQLAALCINKKGLVPFNVTVQNDHRWSTAVSFTKTVNVTVKGFTITITREHPYQILVNGELLNLPLSLIEGQVSVFRSGWFAVVQTSFGLRVTFDWNSFATVTVPSTYMGAVCGLCGNYNGNPKDDLTVRGTTLPSSGPVEFGASWIVAKIPGCVHGCTDSCLACDPAKKSFYGTSDFCGLLRDPQGPFRDCQTVLNPEPYFEGCVYDVCLYNGRRDILCQSITAYVSACQLMGKTISPWRTAEFCGVQCPVHSHYELCGSGCEVTCHSLAPPTGCRSHCTEGCVCDQGYIRSGDRCVPLSQCGCLYGNRYYLLYQQFYPGNNCEQVCTCSADGQVVCNKLSCGSYEKCELVDGVRRCQPIGKAVCEAAGDPHYMSFDRHRFDFQGTCTYILSQSCGLEQTSLTPFSIQVENERWQSKSMVAVTKLVALTVYGSTLIIRKNEPQILVNGVLTNVPYSSNSLNGSLVQAYKDGSNYVILTGFGLRVTYDRLYYVTVTVPGNYRGKTCGLCGNFDGVSSNDFRLPDGNITQDVNAFGRAWKVDVPGAVCLDGCKSGTCLDCDPRLKAIYERRPYCGVLVDPSGPFAACHAVLNPSAYLNDCVFDTCASAGSSKVVCDSVARYAFSCRAAGVIIQKWRTDSFCPMPCPAHSHYELCADVCSTACPGITTKIQCPQTCTEGCACDSGYLFDGQQCVEHQQCGCYEQGRTFKAGEVVYLDQCEQKCQCDPGKGLSCERVNCPNDTQCLLRAGVWACYHQDPCQDVHCREKETCRFEHGKAVCVPLYNSTCWAWGDPHYHTFDGYEYDFQGTCKYVLSKTCGNLSGLAPFSVTESNEYRGDPDVSYVREVEVIVYGNTLTMENHQKGLIMVDGLVFNLPLDLHDGRVKVRESGNAVLLETDFGLRVSYDWDSSVDLQLPSSYYGVVCGLCGNFNENAGDELRNPAGNLLPSVYQWAKSWRAEDNVTPVCHDGCETNCPVCSHDIRALYETDAFCGVLTSTGLSVFNACHAKVNPQTFQQSCVYDLCFSKGGRRILCQALETYVARCRQEGIVITDWREKLNCSMTCPPNSHYEACASPCPVTCPYPDQQHNCTDTCVEACVCDRGFVLSSGTCVPTNQCGCSYEGAYYHQGQTFWADDQCHRLCECDSNLRVVVCRESSCAPGESCSVVNGRRSCQPMSSAVCVAAGDPHYHTFDGLRFDFQGTCVYQLAALCINKKGLVPFNVTVQNDHRWSTAVSFTKTVNVTVKGFTITITREHPYQILFDGQLAELPLLMQDVLIVFRSGNTAVLKTNFGLQVTFDWSSVARVTLPRNYSGAVCGLCGNFNGVVQDDFAMRNSMIAPNASSLGQSWQVAATPECSSGDCLGIGCSTCPATQRENARRYCEIITNQTGPFRECHAQIDPGFYIEACILDTCHFQGHQAVLCDAVAAYASACQSQSVTVHPWRNATFCPLSCPPNSHYNPCAPGCSKTCVNLSEQNCSMPCAEACQCDHGYILSGQTCVPQAECGCFYQGRYYKKHQMFYAHEQCLELCRCGENGTVSCQTSSCGSGEACRVVNGVLGCHPVGYGRCVATGDPHYYSFDGRRFDFQGACAYTLAKVCDRIGGRLIDFSVDTKNELIRNSGVSVIKNLTVTVYNLTISIRQGERWRVIVNNEFVNLPISLGHQVTINQVGFTVVVQTDFGLRVLYDAGYHAEVHVPSNYQGSMCGLCGNYNGIPADDFLLPNGTQSSSVYGFGEAWALPATGVQCGGGDSLKQCNEAEAERYRRDDACGLMATAAGPFGACHAWVNPQPHVINCVFDMCIMDGDRSMLCHNLQAYAIICHQAGIQIMPWRNSSFCPADCPANSHYVQCSNNCVNTCASLSGSVNSCPNICMEGCQCDEGFLSDGDNCVSVGDCGCVHNGKYLKVGEVLVTDTSDMKCVCHSAGVLECVKQAYATGDNCDVQDGKPDCYQGLCVFDADDQLQSFDGVKGMVGRPGAFQMAFLCDQESPDWFRVVLDARACAMNDPGNVMVFFQDMVITVNNRRHTWVNGKKVSYPFTSEEGVSVSYRNEAVVIEKMPTMRLTYSVTEGVVLSVNGGLTDQVCGACGNFNGDTADDMTTSDGRNSTMMSLVVSSWQAEDFFTCGV